MKSMTRAAFAMLLVGTLLKFLGFILPFWFSRGTSTKKGVYWNIMYGVACLQDNCDDKSSILKESNVFLFGVDTGVQLEAIAAIAIISFIFCVTAVILSLVFQFGMCGLRRSYFYIIMGCFMCVFISVLLNFITVILAAVALSDFFELVKIQNAFEFPWAVLLFGLGGLCLAVSVILYTIILTHWKRYRHIYSRERYYFDEPERPIYTVDKPDYDRKGYNIRRDSLRRTYAPPRDYVDDDRRVDYVDDYRRDYRDGYRDNRDNNYRDNNYRDNNYRDNNYRDNNYRDNRDNNTRKSIRPYERRTPKDYRKSGYNNDRNRDTSRYSTRNDRAWHSKVDDVVDESNWLRMTSGIRGRDNHYRY